MEHLIKSTVLWKDKEGKEQETDFEFNPNEYSVICGINMIENTFHITNVSNSEHILTVYFETDFYRNRLVFLLDEFNLIVRMGGVIDLRPYYISRS